MPYLTPRELPEEDDCRPLFIPADPEWLALFGGALTELQKTWNWEYSGGLTIAETIEKVEAIIENWYSDPCGDCSLPFGGRILRLNSDGIIQELVGEEWVEPTGDYELPPTPAREEASEVERLCAAAANATATLQAFYEDVSDSFNDSLDTAAAAAALAATVAGLLGSSGFGLALASLIAIGIIVFRVFYDLMEFVTADLWTTDFNEKMQCVLFECASEDADVVHFDYPCVLQKLSDATRLTLDLEQVRLFGQIAYLLQFIGAQGLDAAGATTSVISPECDDCNREWCYSIDFELGNGSADGVIISGGTWSIGVGIVGEFGGSNNKSDTWGYWEFPEELDVYEVGINYALAALSGENGRVGLWVLNPVVNYREDFIAHELGFAGAGLLGLYINEELSAAGFGWDLNSGESDETATLKKVIVRYRRSEPLWEPNCDD